MKVDEARHILIASKEKCIIDILYQQKKIVSVKDVEMFLYDDLRIDRPQLGLLNLNKVRFIVKHYSHVGVLTLPELIERARL